MTINPLMLKWVVDRRLRYSSFHRRGSRNCSMYAFLMQIFPDQSLHRSSTKTTRSTSTRFQAASLLWIHFSLSGIEMQPLKFFSTSSFRFDPRVSSDGSRQRIIFCFNWTNDRNKIKDPLLMFLRIFRY